MNSQSNRLIQSEDQCLWIEVSECDMIHAELLVVHGGLSGIRDQGALESALMRGRQKLFYLDTPLSLSTLAAAYSYGIATSHPYNDGNKRTAFAVANVFLLINGTRISAPQEDVVKTMLLLAGGELSEENLEKWITVHLATK